MQRKHSRRVKGGLPLLDVRQIAHRHVDVAGILLVHNLRRPQVQGEGTGEHDHDHRTQDTDVGQTQGVLFHAVEHTADADETAGFVIEFLVAAQGLQEKDADGGEEAVGPDDDQKHRPEKEQHGLNGVLGGNGVPAAQRDNAQQGEQPAGFGFPLPGGAAVEQLNGVGDTDFVEIAQQRHHQQHAEYRRRLGHA